MSVAPDTPNSKPSSTPLIGTLEKPSLEENHLLPGKKSPYLSSSGHVNLSVSSQAPRLLSLSIDRERLSRGQERGDISPSDSWTVQNCTSLSVHDTYLIPEILDGHPEETEVERKGKKEGKRKGGKKKKKKMNVAIRLQGRALPEAALCLALYEERLVCPFMSCAITQR